MLYNLFVSRNPFVRTRLADVMNMGFYVSLSISLSLWVCVCIPHYCFACSQEGCRSAAIFRRAPEGLQHSGCTHKKIFPFLHMYACVYSDMKIGWSVHFMTSSGWHIYILKYLYACIHISNHVRVCMHTLKHVCVCIYILEYLCVCIHVLKHLRMCIYVFK